MSLVTIGITFVEIGLLLVFSLGVAHILKKFDIPSVLGLILGGLCINAILLLSSHSLENFFTDFASLKALITELALAWIGYEIGAHIDLKLARSNGRKFGGILLAEAIGAFLIVSIGFTFLLQDFGIALLLGSIAMATAPAATSQVLKEYHAQGELTQTILFIVAFDDIISILFANVSLGIIAINAGSNQVNLLLVLFEAVILIMVETFESIFLAIGGAFLIVVLLRLHVTTDQTLIEWLLGVSFLLIAISLLMSISVIMTMFVWGLLLRLFEDKEHYTALKQHIEKLDVLTVPIVLLFFILIGLSMELNILLQVVTLTLAILYFLFRAIGKATGTYTFCQVIHSPPQVKNSLPISLLTQAGIAIGLAGLSFQKLTDLGLPYYASLIINVVGVSVILSELFGPFLLKQGLIRSGEAKLKTAQAQQLNVD